MRRVPDLPPTHQGSPAPLPPFLAGEDGRRAGVVFPLLRPPRPASLPAELYAAPGGGVLRAGRPIPPGGRGAGPAGGIHAGPRRSCREAHDGILVARKSPLSGGAAPPPRELASGNAR